MSTWILLRGLARDSRHWGLLPELLRVAQPGAQVVALDLPGNGRMNSTPSPTTVAAMADDVRAQLLHLGIAPPYHLLAMSLGGMVAMAWATSHPDEVAGVVLINTSGGGLQPFFRRLRPRAWWPLLRLALPGLSAAQHERIVVRLTSHHHAEASAEWIAWHQSHPVSLGNAWRQLLAAQRFEVPPEAPRAPLLLLSSARDGLVDPRCSHSLAHAWQTARAEHPTAGHDLALDDPAWLVECVRLWQAASAKRSRPGPVQPFFDACTAETAARSASR